MQQRGTCRRRYEGLTGDLRSTALTAHAPSYAMAYAMAARWVREARKPQKIVVGRSVGRPYPVETDAPCIIPNTLRMED